MAHPSAAHRGDGLHRGPSSIHFTRRAFPAASMRSRISIASIRCSAAIASAATTSCSRASCAACKEHGLVAMMDLVVNHTARDNPLVERHPHWFAREREARMRSPRGHRSRQCRPMSRSGAISPRSTSRRRRRGEAVDYFARVVRHYARWASAASAAMPPTRCRRGSGARSLPRRARSRRGAVCAETLGARLRRTWRRSRRRLRLSLQQRKWWDFASPWLLEQYDGFRPSRPRSRFPKATTPSGSPPSLRPTASSTTARSCGAMPPGLCLRRVLLRRRDDADGIRVRLAPAARRREDAARRRAEPERFDLSASSAPSTR